MIPHFFDLTSSTHAQVVAEIDAVSDLLSRHRAETSRLKVSACAPEAVGDEMRRFLEVAEEETYRCLERNLRSARQQAGLLESANREFKAFDAISHRVLDPTAGLTW